jgi:hypothetical protein
VLTFVCLLHFLAECNICKIGQSGAAYNAFTITIKHLSSSKRLPETKTLPQFSGQYKQEFFLWESFRASLMLKSYARSTLSCSTWPLSQMLNLPKNVSGKEKLIFLLVVSDKENFLL